MTSFVTDLNEDILLREKLQTINLDYVLIEPIEFTTLKRIYTDEELPKHKSYIPFNILTLTYNKNREDLDKEILSALTKIRIQFVTQTSQNNGILVEFFINIEPLWIDSEQRNHLLRSLELSENMKLVTTDPLIAIYSKDPKIIKHPFCDVWMCPENYEPQNLSSETNVFSIPKESIYKSIYDEIIQAYGYQLYDPFEECECPDDFIDECECVKKPINYEDNMYLTGNKIFDKKFFLYAQEEILEGNIPLLSVDFDAENFTLAQWKAAFTNTYIETIYPYAYYTPETINTLEITDNDDGKYTLYFLCANKQIYESMMNNHEDPNNYIVREVSEEQIIPFRYDLSMRNIRSFIIKVNVVFYLCAKELPELSLIRDIDFDNIINTVIGDSGKVYPLTEYFKSEINDTFEKYKIYIGYNKFGYYSYGPLKGLIDNPYYSPFVDPLEERVVGRQDKDKIIFEVIHPEKDNLFICELILYDDDYINIIRDKLNLMVQYGYFYTYWSKTYIQTFNSYSNVPLKIPDIILNGYLSREDSIRASEFIISIT